MKHLAKMGTIALTIGYCSISQSQNLPSSEEFQNLLTGCAIGSKLEVDADLVGSIADIYRGDKTQGKAVIKNETKFLELIPEEDRLEAYKLYTACIKNILPQTSSQSYRPPYNEPSEEEMKQAIVTKMLSRGGALKGDDKIAVENPLNGVSIEILEFEKLGCEPASYGTGYFCNYRSTTGVNFFSNERSSAGQDHARAVNMLFGLFNGGKRTATEASIRRFMKSKTGWIVSED